MVIKLGNEVPQYKQNKNKIAKQKQKKAKVSTKNYQEIKVLASIPGNGAILTNAKSSGE